MSFNEGYSCGQEYEEPAIFSAYDTDASSMSTASSSSRSFFGSEDDILGIHLDKMSERKNSESESPSKQDFEELTFFSDCVTETGSMTPAFTGSPQSVIGSKDYTLQNLHFMGSCHMGIRYGCGDECDGMMNDRIEVFVTSEVDGKHWAPKRMANDAYLETGEGIPTLAWKVGTAEGMFVFGFEDRISKKNFYVSAKGEAALQITTKGSSPTNLSDSAVYDDPRVFLIYSSKDLGREVMKSVMFPELFIVVRGNNVVSAERASERTATSWSLNRLK